MGLLETSLFGAPDAFAIEITPFVAMRTSPSTNFADGVVAGVGAISIHRPCFSVGQSHFKDIAQARKCSWFDAILAGKACGK